MGKVIKILASVLSSLLLVAIILPIFISLMLHINSVQNFVVRNTASILSKNLGTKISVENVSIKLFNRISLDGLYVEDSAQDTLLYARNLTVGISHLGFKNKNFAFSYIDLQSPRFYMRQMPNGISNFKEILLKLQNENKEKKLVTISSARINVEDMTYRFKKLEPREREYGVNFDDLYVSNASISVNDVTIIRDSINLNIENISLKDKSGFEIDKFSARRFIISNTCLRIDELKANLPESKLNAPYLYFDYDNWQSYSDFINVVNIDAAISNSDIGSSSIAFFAPGLRQWGNSFNDVTATVNGYIADLDVQFNKLQTENNTDLVADVNIKGIPYVDLMYFDIDLKNLNTNARDTRQIIRTFSPKSVSMANNKVISRLGNINLKGQFKGLFSEFRTQLDARTTVGNLRLNVGMNQNFLQRDRSRQQQIINAEIDAQRIDLGILFDNENLGTVSLSSNVGVRSVQKNLSADIISTITSLEFNDYNYSDIHLNGVINNEKYQGMIVSSDKNLEFQFDGSLDFADQLPKYDFDLNLSKANLTELNLNQRDSVSVLSCSVKANGSGDDLNNMNGTINIDKLSYINHIDTVKTDLIKIVGTNNETTKSISLSSSFADLTVRSGIKYNQMGEYLESLMSEYLPVLSTFEKDKEINYTDQQATSEISKFSLIKLDVKQANNVAGIFLPGLNIAQGTSLSLIANPEDRKFSFSAKSDYIERDNFFVSNLSINSFNHADSLSFFLRADDLFSSGIYLPNLSIIGEAQENQVELAARFNNTEAQTSALLNVNALLQASTDSLPEVRLSIDHSNFKNKDKLWDISSKEISYKKDKLEINDFIINNKEQLFHINGIASKSYTDTLKVNLESFDISPLTSISENMGYNIGAIVTGDVNISSMLKSPNISADLGLDSINVNDVDIAPSRFLSQWDFQRNRARFTLNTEGIDNPVLVGYYSPTDQRYLADVELPDVDLQLLSPLLQGVLIENSGKADAKFSVSGQGSKPLVSGIIEVDNFNTKVEYTNVEYSVPKATLELNDNTFTMKATEAFDTQGNSAQINMTLKNQYFKNFSFDIGILPNNIMVLNTTPAQNDLFYGTVYASGGAKIVGDRLGVTMDIIASTDNNSTFIMPYNGTSDISAADFITFVKPQQIKTDSIEFMNRKRRILERKNNIINANKGNLNINMAVTINPNAEFTLEMDPSAGGSLTGRGNGVLNIAINPKNDIFSMYGDYNITEGMYLFSLQNIIHKRFVINPGSSIVWTGDPLDAVVDITAIYKVKASLEPLVSSNDDQYSRNIPIDCQIKLTDKLLQPIITFDVEVPNAEPEVKTLVANAINTQEMMATQFFTLLAFNSFYSDRNNSQNINIGAMGGSVTGFEFLTNQLSNWISSDKYNIGIRYRPKGDTTSDELDIDLSTAIIDNRLLLEVEGNFDFGNNSAATTSTTANSLTGDFYLTWLIDRAGSLKAKAFSRTIDSFDENQGLQENGVGIYYSENFNTFSDIITNFRNRYKRKVKRKRLEAELKQEAEASETQDTTN